MAGRFELHDEDAELITTWASLETQTLKSWVRLSLLDTRGRATHTQEFELDDGRVAVEKSRVWEDFQLVPRAALRDATSAVIRVFEGSTLRAAWAVNEAELRKGR